MDFIKFNTHLKASGKEYKQIVFWNRFIRNPIETILTLLPAAITIPLMIMGHFNTYLAVIYAACWSYPIYIFLFQFNNAVNYHLKHRDPSEEADCVINMTPNCIIADIEEHNITNIYEWDSFKTIYCKFGYYMFFDAKKMLLMLRIEDMTKEQQDAAGDFIRANVNQNNCKVLF